MRKAIVAISLLLAGKSLHAQDTIPIPHASSFIPLPLVGYAQEKGFEFGVAALYSYYADKRNPSALTRNSTASAFTSFTTRSQFKADLRFENWTRNNDYHIKTNFRYHNFPFYFYGVGDTTHYDNRSLVGNKRYKLLLEAEKRITSHFYAGFSIQYQHDRFTENEQKGVYPTADLQDKEGGYATFLGVTGIYDNRDNQNYTTKGSMFRFNVAYAPSFLSKHPLWRIEVKANHFIPISPKSTLGLNAYGHFLQGSTLPFYLLPEMGNDNIMRGYYTGRYRDQNYLAAQAEYRYFLDPKIHIKFWFIDMRPTFALAGFAGAGTVFKDGDFTTEDVKPNYGMGIRWFYDKVSRITVRLDYGWGEKLPGEKRQGGFYLSLSEAF